MAQSIRVVLYYSFGPLIVVHNCEDLRSDPQHPGKVSVYSQLVLGDMCRLQKQMHP